MPHRMTSLKLSIAPASSQHALQAERRRGPRRGILYGVKTSPEIPAERQPEYEQLMALLLENAVRQDQKTRDVADWIARSALEPGHLWRSMGVSSRSEVREIMRIHFPALEQANDKDMRWKKFLYKRMCGWSGFSA